MDRILTNPIYDNASYIMRWLQDDLLSYESVEWSNKWNTVESQFSF